MADYQDDVVLAIKHIFTSCSVPNLWKQTFIALVPKVCNPQQISDYWPINLYNTTYKMITKLFTNCLSPLLSALLPPTQGLLLKIIILLKVFWWLKKLCILLGLLPEQKIL